MRAELHRRTMRATARCFDFRSLHLSNAARSTRTIAKKMVQTNICIVFIVMMMMEENEQQRVVM